MDVYSVDQVKKIDERITKKFNISEFKLMQKAGNFAFEKILEHFPDMQSITVICGMGNNGGDGYVVAGCAARKGFDVSCLEFGDLEDQSDTAKQAKEFALSCGVSPFEYNETRIPEDTIIVDALLGIGLTGTVKGGIEEVIEEINSRDNPVVSLDVPSGLDADDGEVLGIAVKADLTVTFIANKKGLYLHDAKDHCGIIEFGDLGVPKEAFEGFTPEYRLMNLSLIKEIHEKHHPYDAHKGFFGHLLIIGGDCGMGGAAIMAAQAALRVGVGKVTLATRAEHITPMLARQPEIMVQAIESAEDIYLDDKTAIVIGPGLGEWADVLCPEILKSDLPKIIDADALNWLGEHNKTKLEDAILTPHPGEASNLLHWSTWEVQEDRKAALKSILKLYKQITLLKGHASLMIDLDEKIYLCPYGNSGMAVPGMGDILSGMIGGIVAQGFELNESLQCAVALHALAADEVVSKQGKIGLCATDILSQIRKILNFPQKKLRKF